MTQRKSIAGAIRQAAQGTPAAAHAAEPEPARPTTAHAYRAGTREGKKMIAAPVDPAAHRQLKMLAAEQGRKQEELMQEAIRDLFTKYGKPPIA